MPGRPHRQRRADGQHHVRLGEQVRRGRRGEARRRSRATHGLPANRPFAIAEVASSAPVAAASSSTRPRASASTAPRAGDDHRRGTPRRAVRPAPARPACWRSGALGSCALGAGAGRSGRCRGRRRRPARRAAASAPPAGARPGRGGTPAARRRRPTAGPCSRSDAAADRAQQLVLRRSGSSSGSRTRPCRRPAPPAASGSWPPRSARSSRWSGPAPGAAVQTPTSPVTRA